MTDSHATGSRAAVEAVIAQALEQCDRMQTHWSKVPEIVAREIERAGYEIVPGAWAREASANDNA